MEKQLGAPGKPGGLRVGWPKASAREFHQQHKASLQESPPGEPGRSARGNRVATGGLAPTASGANSVASALGNLTRRDPGEAVRTYHEGCRPTLKTGTFYLAGNRNFLFGSDIASHNSVAGLDECAGLKPRIRDN